MVRLSRALLFSVKHGNMGQAERNATLAWTASFFGNSSTHEWQFYEALDFLFPLTTATTGPLTIEVIAAVVDVVVVGVVAAIQPLKSDKIFLDCLAKVSNYEKLFIVIFIFLAPTSLSLSLSLSYTHKVSLLHSLFPTPLASFSTECTHSITYSLWRPCSLSHTFTLSPTHTRTCTRTCTHAHSHARSTPVDTKPKQTEAASHLSEKSIFVVSKNRKRKKDLMSSKNKTVSTTAVAIKCS